MDGGGLVFTLAFDSSPVKGEGDLWLVWTWSPASHPALWFPAYAGMTVRGICGIVTMR